MEAFALSVIIIRPPPPPQSQSRLQGAGTGSKRSRNWEEEGFAPALIPLLPSLTRFNLLLLCAQTTEPAPSPPLSHLWLPCPCPVPPWVPKGRFITPQLPALPPPNMCGAHGLLPRPGAARRGPETDISPLGRFSSARRAWGLCLAPPSSPRALSR